MTSGLQYMPKT